MAALRGAAGEVRAVGTGMGPVWVALTRGSWRLLGLGCRCLGQLAGGIWRAVSLDPTREEQARAKALKTAEARNRKRVATAKKAKAAAKAKAAHDVDDDLDDLDDEDLDDEEAPPPLVLSAQAEAAIRTASARPLWESLALLGLGGAVATVGTTILVRVAAGPAADWAEQVWESWSGLITTGVLTAWTTGALVVGPSLAEAEEIRAARRAARAAKPEQDQELAEDGEEEDEEGADPVTALVAHVLEALAAAEVHPDPKLRKGVHVRDLIASADAAGLLRGPTAPGQMRAWLGLHGIPTKQSLALPSGTTYGVRVEDVVAVLGRPLRQALAEGFRLPLGGAPEAAPEGGPPEAWEQVGGEAHPTPAAPPSLTLVKPPVPTLQPAPAVAQLAAGVVALRTPSPTDSSDRSRRA
ncbi:hypothetical protein Slala03_77100 [Streptomyces lavendulae subsp. lavendulae]|nr:hypothetical protein Slala03_77100 [Streptomyces lavendulae subsp. lavendulae]